MGQQKRQKELPEKEGGKPEKTVWAQWAGLSRSSKTLPCLLRKMGEDVHFYHRPPFSLFSHSFIHPFIGGPCWHPQLSLALGAKSQCPER